MMTEQELKKLNRVRLIETIQLTERRCEELEEELAQTKRALSDRRMRIQNAGSLAEATVSVNSVMEAADAAAKQYLDNIRTQSEESERRAKEMIEETQLRCDQMIADAREKSQEYWDAAYKRLKEFRRANTQHK